MVMPLSIFMKNKLGGWVFICILLGIILLSRGRYLWVNLWFKLIEPEYVIPEESSIFDFKPNVMNPGSGDWWVYGEDSKNYYYFTGSEDNPYILIEKSIDCPNFDPLNYKSWCNTNLNKYQIQIRP